MKLFSLLVLCFPIADAIAQIGIGTVTPHSTAILEVNSSTKGLLIPRMSSLNRDNIVNPATGLIVFWYRLL